MHPLGALIQYVAAVEMSHKLKMGRFGFGVRLVGERYILDGSGQVCPIGALLYNQPARPDEGFIDAAAHYLGVTHDWVAEFIHGFDGRARPAQANEGFNAGVEISKICGFMARAERAKPRRRGKRAGRAKRKR